MKFLEMKNEINMISSKIKIGKVSFLFANTEGIIEEYKYSIQPCSGCDEEICGRGVNGYTLSMLSHGYGCWTDVCNKCVNTAVHYDLKYLGQLRKHLGKE